MHRIHIIYKKSCILEFNWIWIKSKAFAYIIIVIIIVMSNSMIIITWTSFLLARQIQACSICHLQWPFPVSEKDLSARKMCPEILSCRTGYTVHLRTRCPVLISDSYSYINHSYKPKVEVNNF